jgi:G:T/U-mismatch repair DNA glycosylase
LNIITHKFIDQHPVRPTDRVLFLGTLYPKDVERFVIPFFYGNSNTLWRILSKAFPEELAQPDKLEEVLGFTRHHNIAVSDVIAKGYRKKTRSGDADLVAIEYNHDLISQIKNSEIETIICTSGNHSKGSFGIFTRKILNFPLRDKSIDLQKGINLPTLIFKRTVVLKALPSPSGAANAGIATSRVFKKWQKRQAGKSNRVSDYRIACYKKALTPFIH